MQRVLGKKLGLATGGEQNSSSFVRMLFVLLALALTTTAGHESAAWGKPLECHAPGFRLSPHRATLSMLYADGGNPQQPDEGHDPPGPAHEPALSAKPKTKFSQTQTGPA